MVAILGSFSKFGFGSSPGIWESGPRPDAQSPRASQTRPSLPSEGSVIAYYWSEFSIPNYLVEEAERAMAEEHAVKLPPRTRTLHSFVLTSVVAFRECRAAGAGVGRASLQWSRGATAPGPVPGREDGVLAGTSLSVNKEAGMRK